MTPAKSFKTSLLAAALALGGCAGLGAEPAGNSMLVYVPEAASVPARLERIDIPEQSGRTPPQASPSDLRGQIVPSTAWNTDPPAQPGSSFITVGDGAFVFSNAARALRGFSPAGPDELIPRLGPPPVVDSDVERTRGYILDRSCGQEVSPDPAPDARAVLSVCPPGTRAYAMIRWGSRRPGWTSPTSASRWPRLATAISASARPRAASTCLGPTPTASSSATTGRPSSSTTCSAPTFARPASGWSVCCGEGRGGLEAPRQRATPPGRDNRAEPC